MTSIKIYGCGSAGMHLANAAHLHGWWVTMVDSDPTALNRVPMIFPQRYGYEPDNIKIMLDELAPKIDYDLVAVATPPTSHINLALKAWVDHNPHGVLIEKPLCAPHQIAEARALFGKRVFVGYTHAMTAAKLNMRHGGFLRTEFRESWAPIMRAHPWNKRPEDTYLGNWRAGGGALGEHSHAIHMWLMQAVPCHGEVVRVLAQVQYANGGAYDSYASVLLECEDGFMGEVIVDTVSDPTVKRMHLEQSDDGVQMQTFGKCDFTAELSHLFEMSMMADTSLYWTESPIALSRGFQVMRIIEAAHRSQGAWVCLA